MWLHLIDSSFFAYLYFFLLAASVVMGYFAARKLYVARNKPWSGSGVESSIIGFFALVISFTLSSAYNSAKSRNALVHQEADAAAQMYRESLSAAPPLQNKIQTFLLHHLDAQLSFYYEQIPNADSLIRLLTHQNEAFIQSMITDSLGRVAFAKFSPSYNSLSAATFNLAYSYNERTPLSIMLLLFSSSLLIGLLIGFMNGFHPQVHLLVPALYVVLVFFTMKTIRDLDNPQRGDVRPYIKNFEDLRSLVAKGQTGNVKGQTSNKRVRCCISYACFTLPYPLHFFS